MVGSEQLKADRGTDVRDVSNGRLVADMDPEQNFGARLLRIWRGRRLNTHIRLQKPLRPGRRGSKASARIVIRAASSTSDGST